MIRRDARGRFRRATVYELLYEAARRERRRAQQSLLEDIYSPDTWRLILAPNREELIKLALEGLRFQPFVGFRT